ncbi:MAG: 3-deoxy-8-phosphooctulonate synthase [Deltaproteobacteria bacterium]|jgi:2-dehydro-3-deoxyphosphooctonate aldolase (KDO 8-P synthase)|nr:3-deoxy-8-phosphooctulonate synthase [Deltaproteobacteria bacterium]
MSIKNILDKLSNYTTVAGKKNDLLIIAGPCMAESQELCFEVCEVVKSIGERLSLPYIFKASFDKANRSSGKSFRGPGLEKGLAILEKVKSKFDVPIITDIHLPEQAKVVSSVADILQIPAFLARQTDLVVAAAQTGKIVNIKKAQFMSANDMLPVVEKIKSTGNQDLLLTERGTFFGYQDLVNDFRSLKIMRQFAPVIYDATHSVQTPGSLGNTTGGRREFIPDLTRAAVAFGIDGLFFETHPNPDKALSDAGSQIQLSDFEALLSTARNIYQTLKDNS